MSLMGHFQFMTFYLICTSKDVFYVAISFAFWLFSLRPFQIETAFLIKNGSIIYSPDV